MNSSVRRVWGCTFGFPMQVLAGGGLCGMNNIPVRSHCHCMPQVIWCSLLLMAIAMCSSQLSAMDVSVRTTMKGAAKCDKHCELQNSVNRQGLERILCFWDIPKSMPASVSILCCFSGCRFHQACYCECLCLKMCWSFLVVLLRYAIDKAPL